ncbi:MAG: hypothetical protein LUF35_04520 [Lachnospiraceae bacterium]|nr:hypothetical protein [Lachnospiraceae bacterium]
MKRCIVCGSIGDDDSTVCKVCGNPFIDLGDQSEEEQDQADTLSEMEKQLKQVWSKVQEEEASAEIQEAPAEQRAEGLFSEPGVTVLPDPVAPKEEPEGEPVSDEQLSAAAQKIDSREQRMGPQARMESEPEGMTAPEEPPVSSPERADLADQRLSARQAAPAADQGTSARQAAPAADQGTPARQAASPAADQGTPARQAASPAADQGTSTRQTARPRRRSGPQIYGQDSMGEYQGAQGVIRRDVQAGHPATEARNTAYQEGAQTGRSAADSGNAAYENGGRAGWSRPANQRAGASGEAGERLPAEDANGRRRPAQDGPVNGRQSQRMQTSPRRMDQGGAVPQQRVSARQRQDMQPYAQVPQEDRQQEKGAAAARKTLEAARSMLTSPLLIFIALFHTVYCAGAVAAIFMKQLDYSLFARLLGGLTLPSQLTSYVSMFQSTMAMLDNGAFAIDLALRIPDLLFLLGIWIVCITVRISKERVPGAGFVFVRIAVIINMIVTCALLLVVLVLSVTLVIASWSAGTDGRLPIAAAVLAATVVVTMGIIMYYFCYLATISAVSKNARTGEPYGKASAYVALVHMILAFTAIINILSGIVNEWIPVLIGGVGKFLWMLLLGVWIFSYRNALSEYNES